MKILITGGHGFIGQNLGSGTLYGYPVLEKIVLKQYRLEKLLCFLSKYQKSARRPQMSQND